MAVMNMAGNSFLRPTAYSNNIVENKIKVAQDRAAQYGTLSTYLSPNCDMMLSQAGELSSH